MSWFQTLGVKLQDVSNTIHQKTLRGGANFLVVSPKVSTILESIPGFAADSPGDQNKFARDRDWETYEEVSTTTKSLLVNNIAYFL